MFILIIERAYIYMYNVRLVLTIGCILSDPILPHTKADNY